MIICLVICVLFLKLSLSRISGKGVDGFSDIACSRELTSYDDESLIGLSEKLWAK